MTTTRVFRSLTTAFLLLLLLLLAIPAIDCHVEDFETAGGGDYDSEPQQQQQQQPPTVLLFEDWERVHRSAENNKEYRSETERELREKIFAQNQIVVEAHNAAYDAGHTSWKMTLNSPFADLTADEFASSYLMEPQDCSATTTETETETETTTTATATATATTNWELYDFATTTATATTTTTTTAPPFRAGDTTVSVDWRTKGIMTPVKDQGMCGSCWTFSTSGCLEAHTCLAYNKDCTHWHGLAEQQLLDCAGNFNNFGCNGGLPSQAYEYIFYNGGMDLETSYEYKASDSDGTCKAAMGTVGAKVAAVFNITSGSEDDLVTAVANVGPVSIAYQVSPDFRFYQHGVYDSYNATTHSTMCHNQKTDVNHAVVAVGLGTTAPAKHNHDDSGGIPYYIVRNSWGTSWGMEGHFWMKRGENLCGVSDCASFPIVPKAKDKYKYAHEHEHEHTYHSNAEQRQRQSTLIPKAQKAGNAAAAAAKAAKAATPQASAHLRRNN